MSGITYQGSELWKSIEYCNDIEQLSNKARYIDSAIIYHKENGDTDNADFFLEAQEHWKTKVEVKIRQSNG